MRDGLPAPRNHRAPVAQQAGCLWRHHIQRHSWQICAEVFNARVASTACALRRARARVPDAGGRMHAIRPPADNRLGDRPGSMTCRIPGSLIEACPSARPARTSSTAMQSPDDRQATPAQRRVSRIAPGRRQRARIGLAVQSWDNEPARHVSKQARSRPARAALARLCARSPSEDTASCDPGSVRAPAQAP